MARKILDLWKTVELGLSRRRPNDFLAGIEELRSGGFAASMLQERVSGTKEYDPDDEFDKVLDAWHFEYLTTCITIVEGIDALAMLENRVLGKMSREEATRLLTSSEVGKSTQFECANCKEILKRTKKQRPRSGRCNACYQWRINHHGEERPIEKSVA